MQIIRCSLDRIHADAYQVLVLCQLDKGMLGMVFGHNFEARTACIEVWADQAFLKTSKNE